MVSKRKLREIASRYQRAAKKSRSIMRVPRSAFSNMAGPTRMKMNTTLRYVETFSLDPPGAGFATYVFSANGLYDPNISGVGHQPRGFDQWMGLYRSYDVKACKITVVPANTSTATSQENVICAVFPSSVSSPTITYAYDALEPRGCKWMTWTPGATITTSKPNPKLTNYVNVGSWFNRQGTDDDMYRGNSTNNPTVQLYWIVALFLDGGTNIAQVNFTVELEYYVLFDIPADTIAS